jgi:dihydrofolate reductase
MTLSLIAAIGQNNELGKDNKLLWDMPADMKHFRDTTRGKAVIMGRKTHESIGRPLPNRRNIVVTRDMNYQKEGIEVVHSMEEALALFAGSDEEVFDIGGAEIYSMGMPFANRLYITHINQSFEADTFFPPIDASWKKVSVEEHPADIENPYPYTFTIYEK